MTVAPEAGSTSTSTTAPALDLREVRRADVYKAGHLAAHLERRSDGLVAFGYTTDWLRNAGPLVASTLPLSDQPVLTPAGAVPPFFAGLLPEGRRLGALRRSVKTSADDELTLVMAVGGDMVGDVRVVPEGLTPGAAPPRLRVTSFDEVRFSDLLAEMDVRVDRVALPGVQDKVSAVMLTLPVSAAGSQLLLKLNPRELKHLVENEHFFLGAARTAGVRTVEAVLVHDRDGRSGLAVTRFDRLESHGMLRSLAVEDGCQVLGRYPSAKYTVRTEDVLRALASACEAPRPAAAELFRQVVFCYLSGNGDAHAKNFSILRGASGLWAPAPAYDLPSTQPYGDASLALSLDGRRDGLTGARFLALAEHVGVRDRAARTIVREVVRSADVWIDQLHELPMDRGRIIKLQRFVANRQRMLHLGL